MYPLALLQVLARYAQAHSILKPIFVRLSISATVLSSRHVVKHRHVLSAWMVISHLGTLLTFLPAEVAGVWRIRIGQVVVVQLQHALHFQAAVSMRFTQLLHSCFNQGSPAQTSITAVNSPSSLPDLLPQAPFTPNSPFIDQQ